MKRATWKKHHKWLGIPLCFFVLMFSLSGILLNHRPLIADVNVDRSLLPGRYLYQRWNGGLLRGTLPSAGILIYGTGGIWHTDSTASRVEDFNRGLPEGADYRNIRSVVRTAQGDCFAAGAFGLYRLDTARCWQPVSLPLGEEEKLTDMTTRGDTLVVAGRSFLYVSTAPYRTFEKVRLLPPDDYDGRVSLFRTVWMLHSGELFGTAGKLVVDAVGIVLILLCLTGFAYWLLPKWVKRRSRQGADAAGSRKFLKLSFLWHDKIGRATLVITLLLTLTGWCLRPPVLIALALNKTKPVPGTTLDSANPWHDKLRMIRYDDASADWLLSTSDGFYALRSLAAAERPENAPRRVAHTPPVSVMGLNVWQKDGGGRWLCGSFSGLFVWDRQAGTSTDYFTGEPAQGGGAPFGKKAVSGFTADFAGHRPCIVEYYEGTDALAQPGVLAALPMSLWNLALEVHSGRIYIGTAATLFFIFLAGIAVGWCLWSGWKLRR